MEQKKTSSTKSRILITILLISGAILLEVVGAILFCIFSDTETGFVETLYYTSQIGSSFFVISGVLIAVWQYCVSDKSAKSNLDIIQVQRAIDLSEYYKDNILNYIPAIRYVFKEVGILQMFDRINSRDMKDFDALELSRLLTKDQILTLQKIQDSDAFTKAILEANAIYNLKLHFLTYEVASNTSEGASKTIKIDKHSIVVAFLANLLDATLNNLEYFALHFHHNTANQTVVYQSLHQTFLENIPYLYYHIANRNVDPSNKLYTNTIWLYNEWQKEKDKQYANHSASTASIQSDGKIISND